MIAEGGSRRDATLTQARLLAVRADRLADRVAEQRRAFHRHHPFERTASVLSPLPWAAAARALPGELGGLGDYMEKWAIAVWDDGGVGRGATALLILVVLGMAALMLWFAGQRRGALAAGEPTRFAKAASSLGVFLGLAVTTPLALLAVTEALQVRMVEISYGITAALFIAMFGYAAALGALAPDAPARRLIAVDDDTARTLARPLVWGTQALAVLVIALAIHRALVAPASLTVATNMVYAIVIGAILLHLLLATRGGGGNGGIPSHRAVAACARLVGSGGDRDRARGRLCGLRRLPRHAAGIGGGGPGLALSAAGPQQRLFRRAARRRRIASPGDRHQSRCRRVPGRPLGGNHLPLCLARRDIGGAFCRHRSLVGTRPAPRARAG